MELGRFGEALFWILQDRHGDETQSEGLELISLVEA